MNEYKIYKDIPTDKPVIRCDYQVAKRDINFLYRYIYILEKERIYPDIKTIELFKKYRKIRENLGISKVEYFLIDNYSTINQKSDIKKHYYIDDDELNKIKVGEKVYIIREYDNSYDNDHNKYVIYDAVCIRKIDNYVEWYTTKSAQCYNSIFKNYYRKIKIKRLMKKI